MKLEIKPFMAVKSIPRVRILKEACEKIGIVDSLTRLSIGIEDFIRL